MKKTVHLTRKMVPQRVLDCFPEYKGQKFQITIADQYLPQNYWDEGSRRYFKFLNLNTGQITYDTHSITNNPFNKEAHECIPIPANFALVEHNIFRGKTLGIYIKVNTETYEILWKNSWTPSTKFPKMDQQDVELTPLEVKCLVATNSYKASYGGITRREHAGMSISDWENAKQSLIEKGFLKKNGAITTLGKNVASQAIEKV